MKKTISKVLNSCKIGDKLTDGKRHWKLAEDKHTGDCAVAVPIKKKQWGKKPLFELWADYQGDVTYLPKLKKVK